MYACILYVFLYVCSYATRLYVYTFLCTYVRMYVCTYVRMHARMHVWMFVCMCVDLRSLTRSLVCASTHPSIVLRYGLRNPQQEPDVVVILAAVLGLAVGISFSVDE